MLLIHVSFYHFGTGQAQEQGYSWGCLGCGVKCRTEPPG